MVDLAALLNGASITNGDGEVEFSFLWLVGLAEYIGFFLSAFFYTGGMSNDPVSNKIYILFIVITIVLIVVCAQEEGSHVMPEVRRMNLKDMLCFWMKKREHPDKSNIKMDAARVNDATYT